MTDIEQKRAFVGELYSTPGWKKKVKKMQDSQVVAIYMREMANPANSAKKEEPNKEDGDDGIPF